MMLRAVVFRRWTSLLFFALHAVIGGNLALAQQPYPSRTVTMIVPLAAGTEVDWSAREYAQRLSERWGVPVVVENRLGAGGDVGISMAAKAPGDGYTLMMVGGSFAINPAINKVSYDPVRSFKPVMLTGMSYFTLAVSSKVRARTLAEFIAEAKARPGELNYASPGNGSVQHLTMEIVKREMGINLTHIPYKGAATAINDLAGGIVDALVVSAPQIVGLEQMGKVRILTTLGPERDPRAPNAPSVVELGFPGAVVRGWSGLMVPASTPPDIVEKLGADMRAVRDLPAMQEAIFKRNGSRDQAGGSPARMAEIIRSDLEQWKKIVTSANIKAD